MREETITLTQTDIKGSSIWGDLQLIEKQLTSVPEFSAVLLPESIRTWAEDIAYRMQVPLDFIAAAFITSISSIIGTRVRVKPKQNDDWYVTPNLWGAIIAPPSSLKTPALKAAMGVIQKIQKAEDVKYQEAETEYNKRKAEYDSLLAPLQTAHKHTLKNQALGKPSKRPISDIESEIRLLEKPEPPTHKRLIINDATVEKVGMLLASNPQGILVSQDEIMSLLASFEKNGHEADRAFYLEAWNGDNSYRVDRVTRESIVIPNLCISLFGTIQPAKLEKYLQQAVSATENDGLLQRMQMMVYPNELSWQYVDEKPNKAAQETVDKFVNNLYHLSSIHFDTCQFDSAAQETFKQWLCELQAKIDAETNPALTQHLSKYRSLMPSLALIFHLIEIADGKTAVATIPTHLAELSAAWCDFLEAHARRIYGLLDGIKLNATQQLSEKLRVGELGSAFTARDIYRKNWKGLNDIDSAQQAINTLIEHNWLRPIKINPAFQQKPTTRYEINPAILEGGK